MDAWTLRAVSGALHRTMQGGSLGILRPDIGGRLRLPVETVQGTRDLWIDLKPGDPWIAAALRRSPGAAPARDLGDLPARLSGLRVRAVEHPSLDRWLRFRFEDGSSLLLELIPSRPRIQLLDKGDVIVEGRPGKRIAVGEQWVAPALPATKVVVDPFTVEAVGEALGSDRLAGIPLWERVTRLFGVSARVRDSLQAELGTVSPRELAEELVARLEDLAEGRRVPLCEGVEDERSLEKASGPIPGDLKIMPWGPRSEDEPWTRDASRVIGRVRGWQDRLNAVHSRVRALADALDREDRRIIDAMARVSAERKRFAGEGESARRIGEALLAGLSVAKRSDGMVEVPDPWNEGETLHFPDEPARSLTDLVDRAFQRQRRIDRGRKKTAERFEALSERQGRLRTLADCCLEPPGTFEEQEAREADARKLGLVVGLRSLRKERIVDPAAPMRLPGVRVFTAPSGETVFGGKGARDNDRLTFKVATEEDFWFHARDITGAHVILRNPQRKKRPQDADLHFAASVAAWYSDGRTDTAVDVAWTRRRNVRRMRGAPRGTVKLKRFEVVRVAPSEPET